MHELLLACADGLAERLIPDAVAKTGVPPGVNGPHHHPETPVRNTAHWSTIWSHLYARTGDVRWRAYCEAAALYLSADARRPGGFTFEQRIVKGKDRCNGVIGSAWVTEALCELGAALERRSLHELAGELVQLHPFNSRYGLWNRIEISGDDLGPDTTLNHQIWFAAACSDVPNLPHAVSADLHCFLDLLPSQLHVFRSGLIYHLLKRKPSNESAKSRLRKRVASLAAGQWSRFQPSDGAERLKWFAYHHFNLYGLSVLKARFPDHQSWRSRQLRPALQLLLEPPFREQLSHKNNPYSWGYNAPGFEIPLILARFSEELDLDGGYVESLSLSWLHEQVERTYDAESKQFSRNTADVQTLTARMYELVRAVSAFESL